MLLFVNPHMRFSHQNTLQHIELDNKKNNEARVSLFRARNYLSKLTELILQLSGRRHRHEPTKSIVRMMFDHPDLPL